MHKKEQKEGGGGKKVTIIGEEPQNLALFSTVMAL